MQSLHTLFSRAKFSNNHFKIITEKKQIVLHHTAGSTADGAITWWQQRLSGKGTVSTPIVIAPDGKVIMLYNINYYAHHLGVKGRSDLDKKSIGIEVVSRGFLTQEQANRLPAAEVIEYQQPFRGQTLYHRYTPAQIETLAQLLPTISQLNAIPIQKYSRQDYFEISKNALSGTPGVYTHVSYNPEKSDLHPQPEIIQLLTALA